MEQLICLIEFTITGIIIAILFDIFRILRKSFKTADWITTIQDILFWISAGIIILYSIFKFNNGEIRIYVFIGILLGILIYMFTISKYIIKYSVIVINFFKKLLSYPINFIIKFFMLLVYNPIKFFLKKVLNMTKKHENKIKIQEKRGILQKK